MWAGALQKAGELSGLVGLVRTLRPASVLEVGSYNGATFWLWALLSTPEATLVSVDVEAGYGGVPTSSLESVGRPGQRVVALRLDSQQEETRAAVERILAGTPLDLVMIDADHSYAGVRRDFELYAPLVRPGGLVAFHDVLPCAGIPGVEVDRFWAEVRDRYEHWEFLLPEHDAGFGTWGGIGVLRMG